MAAVKAATRLPVIVNGDIVDARDGARSARAIGSGRGDDRPRALGKPWIAHAVASALQSGGELTEPDVDARLPIILDHFRGSLAFYGDRLGLKTFRKHLARYIEDAPLAMSPTARRTAKAYSAR